MAINTTKLENALCISLQAALNEIIPDMPNNLSDEQANSLAEGITKIKTAHLKVAKTFGALASTAIEEFIKSLEIDLVKEITVDVPAGQDVANTVSGGSGTSAKIGETSSPIQAIAPAGQIKICKIV